MKPRIIFATGLSALLVIVPAAFGQSAASAKPAARTALGLPVVPKNAAGYRKLSAEQLAASMAGKKFTLVNVHVPFEANLPKTDLSIPFDQIKSSANKLPRKDAPIVIYCRSGTMSTQAAKDLAAAGYTRVYELDGGFNAWKAAGHRLVGSTH
ncbi:MAG: rhodanese-like domain-containing protein [Betaproteobacteria bacterium]|nr:rhodanese-like domain-containing protein [Betaproteobacteria bacterium]